jgi:iron complex transport system ATP-binding protein
MELDFDGVTASHTDQALILQGERPLEILASAISGGGLTRARWIINRHVDKDYDHPDPARDLQDFAQSQGIDEPFVGLLTAVYMRKARAVTLHRAGLTVAALVTAGISNATAVGLSRPVILRPGTINVVLLIDACLTPAAMVNAVITATEAKTDVLLSSGVCTPDGRPATGTSTDAVVVACTGWGGPLPYAGPATPVGWLVGQGVRQALQEGLRAP